MHRALHLSLGWSTASASPVQPRDLRVREHSREPGHADVIRSWACVVPLRLHSENKTSQASTDCTSSASSCRPEALANSWVLGVLHSGYPTASTCPASLWHCRMTVVTPRNGQHCCGHSWMSIGRSIISAPADEQGPVRMFRGGHGSERPVS